jgi:dTDP-glucose 4,6-dehydratase
MGTLNVLNASLKSGVTTFVNISTDKAADPSSVLGRSKLLSEELTAWASGEAAGNYLSVRFGNVLGSRGSLVPTLTYLVENNLPITITDPEATRYFMTIPEACQLVMQAGTETLEQSIFILDMGEPVKILDIANRIIEISGKEIDIVFTGLRRGEKLHESLHLMESELSKSSHHLVWTTKSRVTEPGSLLLIRETWGG